MSGVSTDPRVGTELLGYRIEELIGRGGMGVVYRAYDVRLKRNVALKLIAPEFSRDERFRERFLRETEVAASLEHPGVVPIYDAGDVEGQLYLAMRYVEGRDLKGLLRDEGALASEHALAICAQVADALDAAHKRGLVHRDVKPSNVLLDSDGHAYLADFGLSRRLSEQGIPGEHGLSLGTPSYVAPEQIEGEEVDGRADLYSLGCLLHECLTGEPPFPRESELAVLWAHLNDSPPAPPDLEQVMAKALAKRPEDRFGNCTGLIAAAKNALGLSTVRRDRRPLLLAAAGLMLAAGAAASGLIFTFGGRDEAKPRITVSDRTVVRIDSKTNEIAAAVEVGPGAKAVAVGGSTVWVYNVTEGIVSAIDSRTNEVRRTTRVSASPRDAAYYAGPVIAADESGAWVVGSAGGRGILTRVRLGVAHHREYPLADDPVGVAVGEGGVWVITRSLGGTGLLRVSPTTGAVLATVRGPAGTDHFDAGHDGIAVGHGAVWLMNSTTAELLRIDPASSKVTGRVDLGTYASLPVVGQEFLLVRMYQRGLLRVQPRTLRVTGRPLRGPAEVAFDVALASGSLWWNALLGGTVSRIDPRTGRILATIRLKPESVPGPLPAVPSRTIAAGAAGVWVVVGST